MSDVHISVQWTSERAHQTYRCSCFQRQNDIQNHFMMFNWRAGQFKLTVPTVAIVFILKYMRAWARWNVVHLLIGRMKLLPQKNHRTNYLFKLHFCIQMAPIPFKYGEFNIIYTFFFSVAVFMQNSLKTIKQIHTLQNPLFFLHKILATFFPLLLKMH